MSTHDVNQYDAIGAGRHLLVSAPLVGDRDDFAIWRERRDRWIRQITHAVTSQYGSQAARALTTATQMQAHYQTGWPAQLAHSTQMIEETLAILQDANERSPTASPACERTR